MAERAVFDIQVPVSRANMLRLVLSPACAIGLIVWGIYLLPDGVSLNLKFEDIPKWDAWGFFGVISIGIGVVRLFKDAVFAYRSRDASGEWYFCLDDNFLIWDVPEHAHGEERGFRVYLPDITKIEHRTLRRGDEMDECEHWIHFQFGEPIQLQSYSGVTLSWLVMKVCDAGVLYEETYVEG